jgi:hypothetical protein
MNDAKTMYLIKFPYFRIPLKEGLGGERRPKDRVTLWISLICCIYLCHKRVVGLHFMTLLGIVMQVCNTDLIMNEITFASHIQLNLMSLLKGNKLIFCI